MGDIYCALGQGQRLDLCQDQTCQEDVCGCCSYCGRPICSDHGYSDKHDPDLRYYCKKHSGGNHKSSIQNIVKKAISTLIREGAIVSSISDPQELKRMIDQSVE